LGNGEILVNVLFLMSLVQKIKLLDTIKRVVLDVYNIKFVPVKMAQEEGTAMIRLKRGMENTSADLRRT
jgi:hypothetical protein